MREGPIFFAFGVRECIFWRMWTGRGSVEGMRLKVVVIPRGGLSGGASSENLLPVLITSPIHCASPKPFGTPFPLCARR